MAKKTKKTETRSSSDIAHELLDVRKQLNAFTALNKALTTELKQLVKDGDTSQDLFKLEKSRTLKIVNQESALEWAKANYPHIVTVDTKAAKTILQREFTLPDGFEVVETERLVMSGDDTEE